MQLVGGQHLAGEHQLFRGAAADAPGEQAVRPHAGKQVEEDLREAEQSALLGDDDVGRKRAFEAAAKGVALHQRDAGEAWAEKALATRVLHVNAKLGVVRKRVAVTRLDEKLKK